MRSTLPTRSTDMIQRRETSHSKARRRNLVGRCLCVCVWGINGKEFFDGTRVNVCSSGREQPLRNCPNTQRASSNNLCVPAFPNLWDYLLSAVEALEHLYFLQDALHIHKTAGVVITCRLGFIWMLTCGLHMESDG